jgi:hypothetical protein
LAPGPVGVAHLALAHFALCPAAASGDVDIIDHAKANRAKVKFFPW